jgi:hypothetical protein
MVICSESVEGLQMIWGFVQGIKNRNLVENLPMIIPGQYGFNCPSGFREDLKWRLRQDLV